MKRIIEWALAGLGAILCVGGVANVWIPQASSNPWPLPALMLIEVAVLGVAGFTGVVLDNGQHSARWGIVAWVVCGGLTALAVIGAFSVSVVVLLAVPALLFGGAAILADIRRQRRMLADLGILTISAVANFALMFALISVASI
jgi:hypothetical protein